MEEEIKCLDKGFVKLIDFMGSDNAIVQAARVSYGEGTKSVQEDRSLIHYLIKNNHWSPIEMVETKWHIKLPIFVARQWVRHRTASINEISGRYSVIKDEFWALEEKHLRKQSTTNKQGSIDDSVCSDDALNIVNQYDNDINMLFSHYNEYLKNGVCREIARTCLPVSTYTEWYWKIDLRNLFNFLKLRMDSHAQKEIREYANAMALVVKEKFPIAWEAFEMYHLKSMELSSVEKQIILDIINDNDCLDNLLNSVEEKYKSTNLSKHFIKTAIDNLKNKLK